MSASVSAAIPGMECGVSHPLAASGGERAWPETNCYIDLWTGILRALALEPAACLSFVFQADWEGDQWTFLKPSLDDLWALYNIDVQELNIWDSLPAHLLAQIAQGNLPLVEVDSFYLPDTLGTAYRTQHTKTTIGVNALDLDARRLDYFHNTGYYTLAGGDDFRSLLQLDADHGQSLVPYTEFAKLNDRKALSRDQLLELSLACARRHLAKRPKLNPLLKFRESLAREQSAADSSDPVAYYHRYAFATVRQLGAAFQMGAEYARWLDASGRFDLIEAIEAMDAISAGAKALLFKMARSASNGKPLQYEETVCAMAAHWETAFTLLPERLSCA